MTARSAAIIALLSAGVAAHADIDYTVTIQSPDGNGQRMLVSIAIPVKSATTTLQIPNFGPGSYVLVDNFKNVADVRVTGDGEALTPAHPNDYTWTVPSGGLKKVVVSYTLPAQITEEMGHYRGPATYMYVVDRKNEKCNLKINLPAGWNIATGLDGVNGKFSASTYDVLADNPVTYGKYREIRYMAAGRPHIIALYGAARNDLDVDYLTKACSFISAAQNDFFGNKAPYSHYVWHFNVGRRPDGGGGLEHLASTEITLANGLGPGIIGVNAHEFFHLWNVKRIRSRVLGPFDYTKIPETGALWWLEGCTEYFSHQLMTRYGFWDDKKWYATVLKNVNSVRLVPARLEVGPYEASFRVKDANNGRGNSNGYKISYYDLGVVAGTCLDIEMIAQTKGKHSLDDVERALWAMCKDDQPGFDEGEIRNQLVKFGGPAMGEFYDKIIMRGGEMPVEEELAKVGLVISTFDKETVNLGFVQAPSIAGSGMRVAKLYDFADSQLKVDDVVTEINGIPVPTGSAYSAVIEKIKPGDAVKLKIKRGEETLEVNLTAGKLSKPTQQIVEDANATELQKALRDVWLYRGKKGWQAPAVSAK